MAIRYPDSARAARNAMAVPTFNAASVVPLRRPELPKHIPVSAPVAPDIPVQRNPAYPPQPNYTMPPLPVAKVPPEVRPGRGLLGTVASPPPRDAARMGFRSAVDEWLAARPPVPTDRAQMTAWRGQRPRFQDYFTQFWNNQGGV